MNSPFQRGAGGINTVFILFFNFVFSSLFSQEINKTAIYKYARSVVDTMSSENMHGRGYVNEGDKIAAGYISNEFKKFGLRSFTDNYYQNFSFPINTFPSAMSVEIDSKKLIAGKDYILKGSSGGLSGTFEIIHFNSNILKSKKLLRRFYKTNFSDKVVLIDKSNLDLKNGDVGNLMDVFGAISAKAKGVVFVEDKLTAEFSTYQVSYLLMEILRSSFSGNEKSISVNIQNKFIPDHESQNIIGYVEGSVYPDSFIVFSAHYDHLGQMGKDIYFPGANDNASGCAMLLNLAGYYSIPANKPKCSIAFIAFGAEEVGLLGSKYYTEHPLFPLKNIKFLLNMDIMGTGEEGITVVNGSVFKKEFNDLAKINSENKYLKDIKVRGKAAISDHYFFSENGVKAFFIYTMGGIKAYHDIYDKAETLPLNEFEDLFKLITKFGDGLQN